ncbi:Negative elongation factor E [Orchesella cincta]|uniref:Negative elongation factor E n=1 Tax=Orchesella cincta TaxID=48709 RepID=A0A1D2N0J7_ORCCI|nr:Negative elongation factor E [Orchesella cincta]
MVYLHFPTTLTNEELLLKDKYVILRKKKKALQEMKAPKPEPEKVNPLKRPLDPKDAKEYARKLIMSGKVSIPSKPTIEKTVFKRSRILERKLSSTGRTEGHGGMTPGYASSYHAEPHFEPFTPHGGDKELGPGEPKGKFVPPAPKYSLGAPIPEPPVPKLPPPPKTFFAPTPPKEPFPEPVRSSPKPQNRPKHGPTIYVGAQDLTEEVLKSVFKEFGKIVNVKIHSSSVGFVTFETAEIADRAITEVNGSIHNEVQYDVQFARRQPSINQMINEASASASWTTLAANQSNKGGHDDRRQQVVYDEPDLSF